MKITSYLHDMQLKYDREQKDKLDLINIIQNMKEGQDKEKYELMEKSKEMCDIMSCHVWCHESTNA